jgi:hypothetical protein
MAGWWIVNRKPHEGLVVYDPITFKIYAKLEARKNSSFAIKVFAGAQVDREEIYNRKLDEFNKLERRCVNESLV